MTNIKNTSNSGSFSNKLNNTTVTLTSNAITPNPFNITPTAMDEEFPITTDDTFPFEITADAADFAPLNLEIDPATLTITEIGTSWIVQEQDTRNKRTYNFYFPYSSGPNPAYNVCIELIRVDEGGGIAMVGTVSMIVPK